jgi:replicative DNA helicase
MSRTNVLPFRQPSPDPVVLPGNIEAEQTLLGSALANNAVLDRCQWLQVEDFLEPVHGRIWLAIRSARNDGRMADPLTVKRLFDSDPALAELDGADYLRRLARVADTIANAAEYARVVKDLSRRRQLYELCTALAEAAIDPQETEDPASLLAAHRGHFDSLLVDESRPLATHVSQVIDRLADEIEHPRPVWKTGVPALDESLGGGIPEGYVLGFEARPKNFKTGCAHTILLALAKQRVPSCYFALEMGSARLAQRMLGQVGDFNGAMFRFGDAYLAQRVERARPALDDLPLWFVDAPGMRFSRLRANADQLMQAHGVRAFVLDYWQLVTPDVKVTNKADWLADVAQWCADHAHQHGTTWVIASQENRTGESYGSDGLAKACDWIAALHKHEKKLIHSRLGEVETLWMDVKYARDGSGEPVGGPDNAVLYIDRAGPHLAQLDV